MNLNDKLTKYVDLIVNDNFDVKSLRLNDQKETYKRTASFIEPRREFKEVFTEFIVNEFVKTSNQSSAFVQTVYSTFNDAIKIYLDKKGLPDLSIIFVFKGGNLLRIVQSESLEELNSHITGIIKKFYDNFFKKSDADFSIYINPNVPNFDTVLSDMTNLSFVILNHLRNEFIVSPSLYFEYYRLGENEKKEYLSNLLGKLNNTRTIKEGLYDFDGKFDAVEFNDSSFYDDDAEEAIHNFNPRKDFEIVFADTTKETNDVNTSKILLYPLDQIHLLSENHPMYGTLNEIILHQNNVYGNNRYSEMFASVNKTTTFRSGKVLSSFNLCRLKASFYARFNPRNSEPMWLKLDGELIDVSIPTLKDNDIKSLFEDINKKIKDYTVTSLNNFKFKGLSISYLIQDLEKALYRVAENPWDDPKYEKRINRLMYMYFVVFMLNRVTPIGVKLQYLEIIKNSLSDIKSLNSDSINKFLKIAGDIFLNNNIDPLKKSITTFPFRNIIENLTGLLSTLNLNDNKKIKNLNNYIDNILLNLDVLTNALSQHKKWIDNKGSLFENSLYVTDLIKGGAMYSETTPNLPKLPNNLDSVTDTFDMFRGGSKIEDTDDLDDMDDHDDSDNSDNSDKSYSSNSPDNSGNFGNFGENSSGEEGYGDEDDKLYFKSSTMDEFNMSNFGRNLELSHSSEYYDDLLDD